MNPFDESSEPCQQSAVKPSNSVKMIGRICASALLAVAAAESGHAAPAAVVQTGSGLFVDSTSGPLPLSARTVLVEVALPKAPYAISLAPDSQSQNSFGPGTGGGTGTGTLAITSLTFSNNSQGPIGAELFRAYVDGGPCGAPVARGSSPVIHVALQPNTTTHMTFPTPLLITPYHGVTCAGLYANGSGLVVDVIGFIQ